MAEYTISYSPTGDGWTSFHSYFPDAMVYMNNSFFTFKEGKLYRHYSNNTRGNYYGVQYEANITTVLNDSPTEAKMFKTIELNSNRAWLSNITTNLTTGIIDAAAYSLKEGDYYAYIKRVAGNTDLSLMSAQGVGEVTTVAGTSPGSITLTFNFDIGSIIAVGDKLYRDNSGIELIGTITGLTSNTIELVPDPSAVPPIPPTQVTPVAGNFILYLKDAQAESYGSRGYYMDLKLTYSGTDEVELFSVSSEIFKSFP